MPYFQEDKTTSVIKPKTEVSSGYKDVPFAIIFLINVAAVIFFAIQQLGSTDDGNDAGKSYPEWYNAEVRRNLPAVLTGVIALSFIFSITFLQLTLRFAKGAITVALWGPVALLVVLGLMFVTTGQFLGTAITLLLAALFAYYAYKVRHRIPLAVANLRTASAAIGKHKSTMFVAFVMAIIGISWFMIWIAGFIGILSTGSSEQSSNMPPIIGFLLLISLYWGNQVFANISHVTVAGTVATWWFSGSSDGATSSSFKRSCTTSFGSICLGSLLVAIVEAFKSMAEEARSNGSLCACFAVCILHCIETLLEYFNRYAFVYVGIYGYKFTTAGKEVFGLLKSHGFTALINDDLTGRALGLCSFLVALFTLGGAVGLYYLFDQSISSNLLIVLLVGGFIIGLAISSIILSVVDSAVATVFVCFAEDPLSLARNHPQQYTPLIAAYNQVYPSAVVATGVFA